MTLNELNMIQDELDDCPCCGKEALLKLSEAGKEIEATVFCTCCGLQLSARRSTAELAVSEVVAGWNQRVYK